MSEKRTEKLPFIDWLRFAGMISIILCHMVQSVGSKVSFLAQIFNLGVQVFFLVSGFSLGLQGEITDIKKWYKRRLKKIFIPYILFLVVLFIVYCFKPYYFHQITPGVVAVTLLGIQGFAMGILGATHTWFITSILIFYVVLPVFSKIWFSVRNIKWKKTAVLLAVPAAFVLTYLLLEKPYAAVIAPVFMSMISYAIGTVWKDGLCNKIKALPSVVFLIAFCLLRIVGAFITIEKLELLTVALSTFGIAFAGCALSVLVFKKDKCNRLVKYLAGISFEVYLYHNMFIEGPIYLMYQTDSVIFNILITTAAIFISAIMANKADTFLSSKLFITKKGIDS